MQQFPMKEIETYKVVENIIIGASENYYNREGWLSTVTIHDVVTIPKQYYSSLKSVKIRENGIPTEKTPQETLEYFQNWKGISFIFPSVEVNEDHTALKNWIVLKDNVKQDRNYVNISVLFDHLSTDGVLNIDDLLADNNVQKAIANIPDNNQTTTNNCLLYTSPSPRDS